MLSAVRVSTVIKGQTAVTAISLGVFVGVSYGRGCVCVWGGGG